MKFLKSNATTTARSSCDRSRSSFRFLDPNELLQRKKERQKGRRKISVAISRGGNRTEFDNPKPNSRLPRRNLLDIDLNTVCPRGDEYLWVLGKDKRKWPRYIDVNFVGGKNFLEKLLFNRFIPRFFS